MRTMLFALAAFAALLSGCAQDGAPSSIPTPSASEAAALFDAAANNVPGTYGMEMSATRDGVELLTMDASFDEPAGTSYFAMKMDASFAAAAGGQGFEGGDVEDFRDVEMYTTNDGSLLILNGTAYVIPPEARQGLDAQTQDLDELTDPGSFLAGMAEENVTVNSVTTTTLRGQPAIRMEVTTVDEEGARENATVYLFQDPTRVARVEAVLGADEEQLAGATMVMDILYDEEVDLAIPDGPKRALGLRYQSDRSAFSFGGGDEGPQTWTFQVDGGIALTEVEAQVGSDVSGAEPDWTMPLSAGTKTEGGVTLTFTDVDGDAKVSQGDTLTIDDAEAETPVLVVLKDLVTGLRVTPGAGALLVALAGLAAALLARRGR